jgi:hypothetical protein
VWTDVIGNIVVSDFREILRQFDANRPGDHARF